MSANDQQHGGDHYKQLSPQPWDVILAWGMGFIEGNVLKYLARWRHKGGLDDLRKARHYLDKLIEREEARGKPVAVKFAEPPRLLPWELARAEVRAKHPDARIIFNGNAHAVICSGFLGLRSGEAMLISGYMDTVQSAWLDAAGRVLKEQCA